MAQGGIETYLTVEELAAHLKLAVQTIRRYVLKREIPYHKIKKAVRFRLSEIERWIDCGGEACTSPGPDLKEGDLFADVEALDSMAGPGSESPKAQKEGAALVETGGPQYDGN